VIRVAVVDDQQLVREGFSLILGAQPDVEVALHASDGQQLVDAVRDGRRIDIALVDIRMPVLDGLAATRALASIPGAPAVIVVTTFDDDVYVIDAIAAGAQGFLLKRCSGQELVAAVRTVSAGDAVLSPGVTRAVMARLRGETQSAPADVAAHRLTSRELDVLALVGAGLNNAEIAERLFLSQSTVKSHVTNVLAKTGSRDRVRAAILAIRAGLTEDPR
jgi:DNA-binding NarL/FixJ family response regulator